MTAKALKIGNAQTLKQFLKAVVEEGVKSALARKALAEKENQAKTSGGGGGDDLDDLFGGSDGGDSGGDDQKMPDLGKDDDKDNKPTPSKTMDDEKQEEGDIDTKDIVEKLNSIRSGRSFKDSGVEGSMEQYIESLSKDERVALFAFLKGIAQIVTGEIPAQTAEKPTDHPAHIEITKTNAPKTVKKKPNVIKGAGSKKSDGAPPEKKGPPEEDTSAPVQAPITAKKRK
jgi:hypothetical protein